jgi:hypothetical protein
MIRVLALLAGLLLPGVAIAAEADVYCLTGTSSTGNQTFAPASAAQPCPVSGSITVAPAVSTYQGTLSVTASAAISTLTLSNSTTFPTAIGKMVIINAGANTAYICWFGGTCSATGGSEPLAAGASDTIYLGAATTSPTAFSTSGTTLAIHN